NNLVSLEKAIDDDTAALILETVPATLGIVIPSDEYMQGVEKLCRTHEVLLIMDEIQTGLGRTGKLWAFEHFGIKPDIVVLGKGLSGGIYPISATVMTKRIESVFHKDPFIHISTFGGSELGCRVAAKVLEISAESSFLAHVNKLAGMFKEKVEELMGKHKNFLINLRQLGLMMGLEFKEEMDGLLITKTSFDKGLLMVYANNDKRIVQFLPPLNIKEEVVDEIIDRLDKSLTAARRLKPAFKLIYRTKSMFEKRKKG
ncbi:MAG: aspartate aminotransferase family protein, partial [Spirochaetales bacterium]|nr:aspartate aminotransferase family protein [Spirochaetales bacterium]